jgi:transcriptional regulator with XRE-family HTH domain
VDILEAERARLSTVAFMSTHELKEIRRRIRAARQTLGWSLADFEIHSSGRVTAVAMGSYERGSRTLTISKLLVICEIFEVSLIHILASENELTVAHSSGRHIYDLRALQGLAESSEKLHLLSYIHQIIRERGDWRGAVISLRTSDIENLGRIFAASQEIESENYLKWIEKQGVTLQKN